MVLFIFAFMLCLSQSVCQEPPNALADYVPTQGSDEPTEALFNPLYFSTLLPFGDFCYVNDFTIDESGRIIAVGEYSPGTFGESDGFMAILNPDTGVVEDSAFFGSMLADSAKSVAATSDGRIFVCGTTSSWYTFPANGQYGPLGGEDVFIAHFNPEDDVLRYGVFGGSEDDTAVSISVDEVYNEVYMIGNTESSDLPGTGPYDPDFNGQTDIFLARISDWRLVSLSYLGGSDIDLASSVVTDNRHIFVVGTTRSGDFPVVNPVQDSLNGNADGFMTVYSPWEIVYSSYYGWNSDDEFKSLAFDSSGNPCITGFTYSSDIECIHPSGERFPADISLIPDAFVAKFDEDTKEIIYLNSIPGNGNDLACDLKIGVDGAFFVAMQTDSQDLECIFAQSSEPLGGIDGFVSHISSNSFDTYYSSYIGGSGIDYLNAIDLYSPSLICLAGWTGSEDFEETCTLFDEPRGDLNGFITIIPDMKDSDGDCVPDAWEEWYGLDYAISDSQLDSDGDTLSNLEEYELGLNPIHADSDGDSLPDNWEVNYGTNPLVFDTEEDPDSDTLNNWQEYLLGTDPHNWDSDSDSLPDSWEAFYGLNPLMNDAMQDADGDGLTNYEEYMLGTNPVLADSDGDSIPDSWEIENGLNATFHDSHYDHDGDGLTNLEEYQAGTNPRVYNITPEEQMAQVLGAGASISLLGFGLFFIRAMRIRLSNHSRILAERADEQRHLAIMQAFDELLGKESETS